MALDKRISDLSQIDLIEGSDMAAMVDYQANATFKFTFSQLLTFVSQNAALGANITYGTANPANTSGNNGDLFINTATNQFLQKSAGAWSTIYSITQGVKGAVVTFSTIDPVNPPTSGNLGDVWINTTLSKFWQMQTVSSANTWVLQFTMASGPAGPRGNSILNGARNPLSTDGTNGDFWINTATNVIWGPKATGAWPASGFSLAPSVPNTILNGTINPANTTGNNGDFYINTTNWYVFGPKASGVWPAGQPLGAAAGFYILISPGDPGISTNGSGQFTYTSGLLTGKSGYTVYAQQLNQLLYTESLTYNTTAGSFSITIPGFTLTTGTILRVDLNGSSAGSPTTVPAPVTDTTATSYSKSGLNTAYPGAINGQYILCPNINIKYLKLDNTSSGNWDSSPYNPVS